MGLRGGGRLPDGSNCRNCKSRDDAVKRFEERRTSHSFCHVLHWHSISNRFGKYVLPKSAYINSKRILSGVEFKFIALKLGDISKELAKGSEIKISGAVDKYVNFDEESMITWKGDNMQVKK